MFEFLRKKSRGRPILDLVEVSLRTTSRSLAGCRDAIPSNFERDSFEYVCRNCEEAAEALLEHIAILQRIRRDREGIRSDLASVGEFIDHALAAIEKARAKGVSDGNFIYASNFTHLFLAAMIADEWERAERLARAIHSDVVIDGDGGVFAPRVRMYAAIILDDGAAFELARKKYLTDIKNPDYASALVEKYDRYDLVMAPIMARDQTALNDILLDRERRFLARASENAGSVRDGMGEHNVLVVDMETIALCHLAKRRGMAVSHSSDIIPAQEL